MENDKKHANLRYKHGLGGGRKKDSKSGVSRYARRAVRRALKVLVGK